MQCKLVERIIAIIILHIPVALVIPIAAVILTIAVLLLAALELDRLGLGAAFRL